MATTASYQATFEGFAARGLDHDAAADLLRRSVELADRARAQALDEGVAEPLFVAASIGPYGAMLADGSEYRGRYGRTVAQLADFHRERFRVLAGTGADVLAVETIPEIEEAEAVAAAPGRAARHRGLDQLLLRGRRAPARRRAHRGGGRGRSRDAPGVVATGVNCTAPEHVDELHRAHPRPMTSLPIAVYPNSGEGWDAVARRWTGTEAGRVDGEAAIRWRAAGALLIGGCCRVSPSQVGAMGAGARDRRRRVTMGARPFPPLPIAPRRSASVIRGLSAFALLLVVAGCGGASLPPAQSAQAAARHPAAAPGAGRRHLHVARVPAARDLHRPGRAGC